MRKITIATALTLLLTPLALIAQDDDMLERLTGERVKEVIYLQLNKNQLKFKLDPPLTNLDNNGFNLPETEPLLISARQKRIKLWFGFYNPYQYSITVGQESIDDPINESGEKFVDALSGYLSLVTVGTALPFGGTSSNNPPTTEALRDPTPRIATLTADPATVDAFKFIRSSSILNWALWAQDSGIVMCTFSPRESILKSVGNIERILFNRFVINKDTLTTAGHTLKIMSMAYAATDRKSFIDSMKKVNAYLKLYAAQIESVDTELKNLKTVIKNTTISGSAICDTFNEYTKQTMDGYVNEIANKYKVLAGMLATLKSFVDTGNSFIDDNVLVDNDGAVIGLSNRQDLESDWRRLKTITITVKKITINSDGVSDGNLDPAKNLVIEKELFKRTIKLVRFRTTWSEASVGLFYANLDFYNYSTTPGPGNTLMVAEPTIDRPRAVGALFYNQVFNSNMYPLFPLLQVGLANGKDYPTLMFGGGVRIISKGSRNFSVTGGIALPFVKYLNTLTPGSTVTGQDQIDKDIRYGIGNGSGFYLGLAWKL